MISLRVDSFMRAPTRRRNPEARNVGQPASPTCQNASINCSIGCVGSPPTVISERTCALLNRLQSNVSSLLVRGRRGGGVPHQWEPADGSGDVVPIQEIGRAHV